MEYNLVITPKAQQSIDDVLKMVGDLWGMESYSKLLHELDRCFEIIQNYPLAFHVNVHYPEIPSQSACERLWRARGSFRCSFGFV